MPQLKLTAQLALNKTGFDAALKEAEKNVNKFAHSLTNRIGSAILSAFGIQKLTAFGLEVLKQGKEIDVLAKRFNLTSDEVQLLQHEAAATGLQFTDLVSDAEKLEQTLSRLRGGEGVIFSRQQVNDLAEAHEKLQAFNDELAKQSAHAIQSPMATFGRGLGKLASWFVPFGPKLFERMFPEDTTEPGGAKQEDFMAKEAAAKRASARVAVIAKETATIREQISQKLLSDEEKLTELAAKREAIFDRIAKTAVERAQKEQDLAANELAAATVQESIDRKRENVPGAKLSHIAEESALGRIGAFSGGAQQADLLATQQKMASDMAAIRMALMHNGIIIKDVAQ